MDINWKWIATRFPVAIAALIVAVAAYTYFSSSWSAGWGVSTSDRAESSMPEPKPPPSDTIELLSRRPTIAEQPKSALSPDGSTVAVYGKGSLLIYDVETRQLLDRAELNAWVSSIAFSPDNRWLAAVSVRRPALHLWDREKGAMVRTIPLADTADDPDADSGGGIFPALAFSPDGRYLAAGSFSDEISTAVYDTKTAEFIRRIDEKFTALRFSNDGGTLYGLVGEGSLGDRRPSTGELHAVSVSSGDSRRLAEECHRPLAISPDGTYVGCVGLDPQRLRILSTDDGSEVSSRKLSGKLLALAFDDRQMVRGYTTGGFAWRSRVEAEQPTDRAPIQAPDEDEEELEFDPISTLAHLVPEAGRILVTSRSTEEGPAPVTIYGLDGGEVVATFPAQGHLDPCVDEVLFPDTEDLVALYRDGRAVRLARQTREVEWRTDDAGAHGALLGDTLVSAGANIHAHDVETGERQALLRPDIEHHPRYTAGRARAQDLEILDERRVLVRFEPDQLVVAELRETDGGVELVETTPEPIRSHSFADFAVANDGAVLFSRFQNRREDPLRRTFNQATGKWPDFPNGEPTDLTVLPEAWRTESEKDFPGTMADGRPILAASWDFDHQIGLIEPDASFEVVEGKNLAGLEESLHDDSSKTLLGHVNAALLLFDLQADELASFWGGGRSSKISEIAIGPDRRRLAIGFCNGALASWNWQTMLGESD